MTFSPMPITIGDDAMLALRHDVSGAKLRLLGLAPDVPHRHFDDIQNAVMVLRIVQTIIGGGPDGEKTRTQQAALDNFIVTRSSYYEEESKEVSR